MTTLLKRKLSTEAKKQWQRLSLSFFEMQICWK